MQTAILPDDVQEGCLALVAPLLQPQHQLQVSLFDSVCRACQHIVKLCAEGSSRGSLAQCDFASGP